MPRHQSQQPWGGTNVRGRGKGIAVQRQWTPTEMPRMRHDMIENARGNLDRLEHPGVRDFLRSKRVGELDEFTKEPVTDEVFESELAVQIDRTQRAMERYRESALFW